MQKNAQNFTDFLSAPCDAAFPKDAIKEYFNTQDS